MASRNKSYLKSLVIVPALKGFYSQCRNCSAWAGKHNEDSTEHRPLIGVAAEHMKWCGREQWSSFTVTSCHTWKTMWDKAWRSFSGSLTSGSECLHCKTEVESSHRDRKWEDKSRVRLVLEDFKYEVLSNKSFKVEELCEIKKILFSCSVIAVFECTEIPEKWLS